MRRTVLIAGLIIAAAPALAADDLVFSEPEDDHLGEIEYEVACLGCHGLDARGDGPEAEGLDPPPADLTTIARRHDGAFPFDDIAAMIDGRAWTAAHGDRTMPVWGERYSIDGTDDADEGLPTAEDRITALVRFLEDIQAE